MRESEKMVSQLGFWSEGFKRLRDWWQMNLGASPQEVQRRADDIWRDVKR